MRNPRPDGLLTIGDVMEITGCPRTTIHRAAIWGHLPVAQMSGNRRLFRPEDVEAWVRPATAATPDGGEAEVDDGRE